jgi:hypothetical protein
MFMSIQSAVPLPAASDPTGFSRDVQGRHGQAKHRTAVESESRHGIERKANGKYCHKHKEGAETELNWPASVAAHLSIIPQRKYEAASVYSSRFVALRAA